MDKESIRELLEAIYGAGRVPVGVLRVIGAKKERMEKIAPYELNIKDVVDCTLIYDVYSAIKK